MWSGHTPDQLDQNLPGWGRLPYWAPGAFDIVRGSGKCTIFKIFFKLYLFIFGHAGGLLLCGLFSSCRERGGAAHCGGLLSGAQALGCADVSGCSSWAVLQTPGSGAQAQ